MPAALYDLNIEQGADFSKSFVLRNSDGSLKDLTNHTARLQIRRYVFEEEILLEATTANNGISINTGTATVTVRFNNAVTSLIDVKSGVYDLELIDATGNVARILKGSVVFDPEVTR